MRATQMKKPPSEIIEQIFNSLQRSGCGSPSSIKKEFRIDRRTATKYLELLVRIGKKPPVCETSVGKRRIFILPDLKAIEARHPEELWLASHLAKLTVTLAYLKQTVLHNLDRDALECAKLEVQEAIDELGRTIDSYGNLLYPMPQWLKLYLARSDQRTLARIIDVMMYPSKAVRFLAAQREMSKLSKLTSFIPNYDDHWVRSLMEKWSKEGLTKEDVQRLLDQVRELEREEKQTSHKIRRVTKAEFDRVISGRQKSMEESLDSLARSNWQKLRRLMHRKIFLVLEENGKPVVGAVGHFVVSLSLNQDCACTINQALLLEPPTILKPLGLLFNVPYEFVITENRFDSMVKEFIEKRYGIRQVVAYGALQTRLLVRSDFKHDVELLLGLQTQENQ
jgi:hypothetical protein